MTLIASTAVDHIDLCVSDFDRPAAFYDAVLSALSFQRVSDDGIIVWRSKHVEIGIRAAESSVGPEGYDRYRVGLHHLAFCAESRDTVDRLHALLQDQNIEILDAPAEYPDYVRDYYAVFFADPDGMNFELVHRPPDWQTGEPV